MSPPNDKLPAEMADCAGPVFRCGSLIERAVGKQQC